MDFVLDLLFTILKTIFLISFSVLFSVFLLQTAIYTYRFISFQKKRRWVRDYRSIPSKTRKWYWKHYVRYLKMNKYMWIIEFIKWFCIDVKRGRDHFKLFGIWCFTGYYGQGKTIGAVLFSQHIKKMFPDYHVYTNFWCLISDGYIEKWEDLLELPRKTIVIFDEIQSTFTSTAWNQFPVELLWHLTQCRKKKLAVFASSPVYSRMSIQLRESCDRVAVCKNVLGLDRLFSYSFYHAAEYEKYLDNPVKLLLHRLFLKVFVASDYDYRMYNTEQIVDRMQLVETSQKTERSLRQLDRNIVQKMILDELDNFRKRYKVGL